MSRGFQRRQIARVLISICFDKLQPTFKGEIPFKYDIPYQDEAMELSTVNYLLIAVEIYLKLRCDFLWVRTLLKIRFSILRNITTLFIFPNPATDSPPSTLHHLLTCTFSIHALGVAILPPIPRYKKIRPIRHALLAKVSNSATRFLHMLS